MSKAVRDREVRLSRQSRRHPPIAIGSASELAQSNERTGSRAIPWLISLSLGLSLFSSQVGSYAALIVSMATLIGRGRWKNIGRLDLIALLTIGWVLLSVTWSYDAELSGSASRGGAIALLLFIAVRVSLRDALDVQRLTRALSVVGGAYATYFLVNSQTYGGGRMSVDTANPNYTAAALATGGVISAWIALNRSVHSPRWIFLSSVITLLCGVGVYQTGSRASLAGLVLGVGVLLCNTRFARAIYRTTAFILLVSALIPFLDFARSLLASTATEVAYSEALTRQADHYTVLSGREDVWAAARTIVSDNWLWGAGLDGYRRLGDPPVLAHSWGLEYLAAVGIFGASAIALLIAASYLSPSRDSSTGAATRNHMLLNAATAMSVVPNLALSTHQWTLWAWVTFALWRRSPREADFKLASADHVGADAPANRTVHR